MSIELGFVAAVAGAAVAGYQAVRRLLLMDTRVNPRTTVYLLEHLASSTYRHISLSGEHVEDGERPGEMCTLAFVPGVGVLLVSVTERLLTAGYQSKEIVCRITHNRLRAGRLFAFLREVDEKWKSTLDVPVELICARGVVPIGVLRRDAVFPPFQDSSVWSGAAEDVRRCASGELTKTGIIVHGPPGTGKTSFARWLAAEYRMPVRMLVFTPGLDNVEILYRFANLPDRCIVLLEDFDAVFDGRKPTGGAGGAGVQYSFDAVLSGLDGLCGTGRGIVFFMTTNDLDKVDASLKDRPGRFRHVLHFDRVDGETADDAINGIRARGTPAAV